MLQCFPSGDTNYSNMCRDESGSPVWSVGGVADENPVFDLITAADVSQCGGAACRAAARAILDYQELLNTITPLRWDLIRANNGATPTLPIMGSQVRSSPQ